MLPGRHASRTDVASTSSQVDLNLQSRMEGLKQQLAKSEETRKHEADDYQKTVSMNI